MTRNEVTQLACNEKLFKTVVKTAFNQRRKTMRNSLKVLLGKECEIFPLPIFDKRPEQLSVAQFIDLTILIEKAMHSTPKNEI
jgi:16S rRNA (adenine1518-N6/adenine1519-N6)-dimethyltransferase